MEREFKLRGITGFPGMDQSVTDSENVGRDSSRRVVRIKDLGNELIGFRGILTRIHAKALEPFGIKTIPRL